MENKPLLDKSLKAELSELYRAPGRHYHGLAHVEALLELARAYGDLLSDPEAVKAAIWFHDAIYDSRRSDNEQRSATLARERLAGRATSDRLERIAKMIAATATHTPPAYGHGATDQDALLFLDMDLSILGASQAEFDRYESAVRREYDWVDDDRWRNGRTDVLRRFADRPYIFHSDVFRRRFEASARRNITRSLARLTDGG
jgi:predicted metal-dependent HD superfamily phosphohydrolase